MILLSSSTCMIANTVLAQCKERPACCIDKIIKNSFIIRLKKKATSRIKHETDINKEIAFFNKVNRAYKTILINKNELISSNLGEIQCNNCNSPPNIKNRKHAQHIQPIFKINRIKQKPLLCYENEFFQHGQFVVIK